MKRFFVASIVSFLSTVSASWAVCPSTPTDCAATPINKTTTSWAGSVAGPWTTITRPSSPTIGLQGFNTTIGAYEVWNGSAWVSLSSNTNLTFIGTAGTSFTLPSASDTLVSLSATQTLSNKTLNGAIVSGPVTTPGSGLAALNFGLAQGSLSIASAGTSYVTGDAVTLSCPGVTFTTAPIVGVTNASGGLVSSVALTRSGVATVGVPATAICTQASTTGTGTGLTVNVTFGVWAAGLSAASLSTGGGVSNGNLFVGAETPSATFAGAEATLIGDRAGGAFTGAANGETAIGHDACGIFGGTPPSGSFNTCVGNDAGRNISGTVSAATIVGQGAAENIATGANNATVIGASAGNITTGASNTVVGTAAGNSATGISGNNNSLFGASAGQGLTSGAQNGLYGVGVAPTLTTGSGDLVIGLTSSCDVAAAGTNDTIKICGRGAGIITVTGALTAGTSVGAFAGDFVGGNGGANFGALNQTSGFFHFPFTNATSGSGGIPTGTPANINGNACVWNDVTFTLNCYSASAGAWKHVAFSASAG